jgi:hypothetical protein
MNNKGGKMTYPTKKFLLFVVCNFLITALAGCATIKEGGKGLLGVSTKVLEDNRKSAITKTFSYDYFTCYTTALDILKRLEAYIYVQDINKHMIAIYVSSQDTTPVGLFFKEVNKNNTQVEVSSPSTYAKEFISGKVFSVLDKTMSLAEIEEEVRVQKTKQQQDLGNK